MEQKPVYDVVIVGAGPAGYFAAYELMQKAKGKKVLLLERGLDIYHRSCPVLANKTKTCPKDIYGNSGCKPACSMTSGFGGCGAYSDGKFNITSEFGGWMTEYLEPAKVMELIEYVDSINLAHGAPKEITDPYTPAVKEIEKKAIAVGLKLLRSRVRHLGTEVNLQILQAIYEDLKPHIEMRFGFNVDDLMIQDGQVQGVIGGKDHEKIYAKAVFLAVGRPGADWLSSTMKNNGIVVTNNRVDIGVRVETNNIVMDDINTNLYEGKFIFNSQEGTQVRTFCSNPSGHVVIENNNGVIVCNGHSFTDPKLGSDNTNFALLVSHKFSEPFKDSNEYARDISALANKLSGGTVIVQKFGDIINGRRSTEKRIAEGFVHPTLKEAVPGDLGLILPYKTMRSIIDMIKALDYVTPGIANDHTLLYGVEAKFYSDRIECDQRFETKIKNLFVGGDGAGITRGLAQAGACGVYVARNIIENEK
jgi:uncharacterized FAD-dependent dehydrogenase